MARPLQIFRFADSVLPTTTVHSSEEFVSAPASYATTQHPGEAYELGSSFYIRDIGPLVNNHLVWEDAGGTQRTSVLDPGIYSGSELAAEIETKMQVYDTHMQVDYGSTASRKFTILHDLASPFELHWLSCQRLGGDLGYDNTANDTGAATYTSDSAVVCKNLQLAGWQLNPASHLGLSIERIMVYATNLGSSDLIWVAGDSYWRGVYPEDWLNAAFVGAPQSATNSRSNDLYTWEVGGIDIKGLALFINRANNPNQATMDPTRLGCIGVWQSANFNGADYGGADGRQIRSAFESRRVVLDTVDQGGLGGNVDQGTVRGYREMMMAFGGWDEEAYYDLDTYLDKYRTDPALWIPDPDSIATDSTLFGFVAPGDWSGVQWRGTNHVRDFTLRVTGARMGAE